MDTSNKQVPATEDAQGRWRSLDKLLPVIIFLTALLPRLAAIGRYITPDEPIWVQRSLKFREALLAADWSNTIQSGHPGVTTTWLGAIGAQLQLWLQPEFRETLEWIGQLYWLTPDNGAAMKQLSEFLTASRLVVIVLVSLGVTAIYWLSRSRLGPTAALSAGLILALDPFTGGLGGLLHVDALLATFMLVAILLLLPKKRAWHEGSFDEWIGPDPWRLILAGVFSGLAILTKTPGAFLLLMAPLILLWPSSPNGSYSVRLVKLAAWALPAAATIFILLPASWAAPRHVWEIVTELNERLLQSNIRPSFFLGEMTLDPGLAFYPLAVIFRLSPATAVGLVLLIFMAGSDLIRRRTLNLPSNILWLLLFALGFLLFINLSAKRFDRYALPALMSLALVAGWSLTAFYRKYVAGFKIRWLLPAIFGLLILVNWFSFSRHPLTGFNWLVGGPYLAKDVLATGWGEGASEGAKWASKLPEAKSRTIFTENVPSTAPFFPGEVLKLNKENLSRLGSQDLILFDNQVWQADPQAFNHLVMSDFKESGRVPEVSPTYELSFSGLPRTAVYSGISAENLSLTNLTENPVSLWFEDKIAIESAGAAAAVWPDAVPLVITWRLKHPSSFQLQLALLDENGRVRLMQETPLLSSYDHSSEFWPLDDSQSVYYNFPLKADLLPGEYHLAARLYDEEGSGLGVFDADGQFSGVYANLAAIQVESPASQHVIEIPFPLDYDLELVGHGEMPSHIESGVLLNLDLWWHPNEQTPKEAFLRLRLGSEAIDNLILGSDLLSGLTYHISPEWLVPADMPAGSYPISLQLMDTGGAPLWPDAISLGEIMIEEVERSFTLPADVDPLNISLGTAAQLQGAEAAVTGNSIMVETVWQAGETEGVSYSAFVHLVDSEGNIVSQDDRLPAVATNSWLPGQVVVDTHSLPLPATGRYQIALGLYNPNNGIRLPMYFSDGAPVPDDQHLIEIAVP